MATDTTKQSGSSQSTQQTTPILEPWQQGLMDQLSGLFLAEDGGKYQASKAITDNTKGVLEWVQSNPDLITDPKLKKILTAPKIGGGIVPDTDKIEKWAKTYQTDAADYLKKNPEVAASMGIGQSGTDWETSGGKVYEPPKIEDAPLYKIIQDKQNWGDLAKAITTYGIDGKGGYNKVLEEYKTGLGTEADTSNKNVKEIIDNYDTDIAEADKTRKDFMTTEVSRYGTEIRGIDKDYETAINELVSENKISNEEAKQLLKPETISFRGGSIPIVSKRAMAQAQLLSDMARGVYDVGERGATGIRETKAGTAESLFDIAAGESERVRDIDTSRATGRKSDLLGAEDIRSSNVRDVAEGQLTIGATQADQFLDYLSGLNPNQGITEYINTLLPMATGQQQVGFQQGVTDTTGSGSSTTTKQTPNAGFLETAANTLGTANAGVGAGQSLLKSFGL